jgi:viroplasmin and RNaseH domain-containing protein
MQIPTIYSGPEGALQDIHGISGACHKHFRTKEQAEAFIEDWKETYAEVLRREVKKALDEGLRPKDMKLDTKVIMRGADQDPAIEGISQRFDSVMSITC